MADNDRMPKVDLSKDKLNINSSTIDFMKLVEKNNLERVQKLKKIQKRNRITALVLGTSVLSIYAYSMYSVQQETFLDDFDEPKLQPQVNN